MQQSHRNSANVSHQHHQNVVPNSPVSPKSQSTSNKPVLDLKELQAFECKLWDYQRQLRAGGVKYGALQNAWTKFIHQYNAASYELENKTRTGYNQDGQTA